MVVALDPWKRAVVVVEVAVVVVVALDPWGRESSNSVHLVVVMGERGKEGGRGFAMVVYLHVHSSSSSKSGAVVVGRRQKRCPFSMRVYPFPKRFSVSSKFTVVVVIRCSSCIKGGGFSLSKRSPKSLIKSIKYPSIQISSANY